MTLSGRRGWGQTAGVPDRPERREELRRFVDGAERRNVLLELPAKLEPVMRGDQEIVCARIFGRVEQAGIEVGREEDRAREVVPQNADEQDLVVNVAAHDSDSLPVPLVALKFVDHPPEIVDAGIPDCRDRAPRATRQRLPQRCRILVPIRLGPVGDLSPGSLPSIPRK